MTKSSESKTTANKTNSGEQGNLLAEGKQSVNLDAPGVSKALAKRILADVDEYCVRTYDGGHRRHLGASLIGDECKRKLWYVFRWCFHEKTDGRKQRLFNRGHREEARFIEWLEGIGAKIWYEDRESDPLYYCAESNSYHLQSEVFKDENSTLAALAVAVSRDDPRYLAHISQAKAGGIEFPQYRISGVMGHFGGSLDGIVELPPRYGIDEPILAEFKTNGTGKGFNDLLASGMVVTKPQHFAQTSTYGSEYKFRYVLYMNICKNDDNLHVEIAKLDHKLGEQMKIKAEQIIMSQVPPPRLSDNPTFYKCGYCAAKDICHTGAVVEVNCRSCKLARPVENSEWFCDHHNGIIPRDFVSKGCVTDYKAITQNV